MRQYNKFINLYISIKNIILLNKTINQYIGSFIISIILSIIYNKKIIKFYNKNKLEEKIRALGIKKENKKSKIASIGGLAIIVSTLIPTTIFANLNNKYIIILIITLVYMGLVGLYDDYIKIILNNKQGLSSKKKILSQLILGCITSYILLNNINFRIRENKNIINIINKVSIINNYKIYNVYSILIPSIVIISIIIFITNATNITDGIDGLAAKTSLITLIILITLAYISSDKILSNYFNTIYIPESKDIIIILLSFIGAILGFLWYNTYPAKIFMGDCGSLTIGSVISITCIIIKKKILLFIISNIICIEAITVIIQVVFFKYTKKISGKGKRIFKIAPIHHHFQKENYHENTICSRFIIIQTSFIIIVIIYLLYK